MRWMGLVLTLVFLASPLKAASKDDALAKELLVTKEELSLPLKVQTDEATLLSPVAAAPEAAKETPKESEIVLNLDKAKKASDGESSVYRVLFSLTLLGAVGAGAFYCIRKYAVPKAMKNQTQIKVLQQHYLGPKKSLAIIRVAGESILIGVTDTNISMIKSLTLMDDEVPEEMPQNFAGAMRNMEVSESKGKNQAARDSHEGEDFSFGSIKDVVAKRLKGMRSLE